MARRTTSCMRSVRSECSGLYVVNDGSADAIAMADILHYQRASIGDIRDLAKNSGFDVRAYDCT